MIHRFVKPGAGLAMVTGLGAIVGRVYDVNKSSPEGILPSPTVPNPNAWDTYHKAFEKLPRKIEAASSFSSPLVREQQEAALRVDAEGLRLARIAQTQLLVFPRLTFTHVDFGGEELAKYRALARLYVADGDERFAAGDEAGALDAYLDAAVEGQQLQSKGTILRNMVGSACQDIGYRSIWKHLHSWSGDVAKKGIRRMETINAMAVPISVAFREEKAFGISVLNVTLNDPKGFYLWQHPEQNARALQYSLSKGMGKPPLLPSLAESLVREQLYLFVHPKREILRDYTTYMDALIALGNLPYAKRGAPPKLPSGPMAQMLASPFAQIMYLDTQYKTRHALLTGALALQAYKAKQGAYPKTLNELCPTYLKSLPADPFSADGKAPLLYHYDSEQPVLYSVGPDGKDDGGTAIVNEDVRSGDRLDYRVQPESKGDIVAGTNLN